MSLGSDRSSAMPFDTPVIAPDGQILVLSDMFCRYLPISFRSYCLGVVIGQSKSIDCSSLSPLTPGLESVSGLVFKLNTGIVYGALVLTKGNNLVIGSSLALDRSQVITAATTDIFKAKRPGTAEEITAKDGQLVAICSLRYIYLPKDGRRILSQLWVYQTEEEFDSTAPYRLVRRRYQVTHFNK